MAVKVWFVNGQSVELDMNLVRAHEALKVGQVQLYTDDGLVVAWNHATHVEPARPRADRDKTLRVHG